MSNSGLPLNERLEHAGVVSVLRGSTEVSWAGGEKKLCFKKIKVFAHRLKIGGGTRSRIRN